MAITTLAQALVVVGNNLQNHPKYSQAQQIQGLNVAQDKIAAFARFDRTEAVMPTLVGGNGQYLMEYALPSLAGNSSQPGCLVIHGAMADDFPMKMMTLEEWQYSKGEATIIQGRPDRYWVRSLLYLDIYPRPGYQQNLKIFYTPKPADMDLATQPNFSLPFIFADAMISYATWFCLNQSPAADGSADPRADVFYKLYLRQRGEGKFTANNNTLMKVRRTRRW